MAPTINSRFRRPVRVSFLIDSLKPAGTETQLLALIRHLDRSRIRPFLCLLDGEDELSRSLEPKDCPVLRLGVKGLSRLQSLAKAWRLARFLNRQRIDVLQVYFPDSTYFGVPVAWLARVPRIVCTRNNIGYWTTPFHRRLGRLCHRLSAGLVANCQACGQAVTDGEGLSPKRIAVLENGVDLGRFRDPFGPASGEGVLNGSEWVARPESSEWVARPESSKGVEAYLDPPRPSQSLRGCHPHCEGEHRIGITANLRPVKDLDVFIRAAGLVADTHSYVTFHIAGEGELRRNLEQLVAQLHLTDRAFLPGTIQDVPGFLAKLDIAVLCSRSEGMSNAILEYMAAGKAIAATAVGGNGQLLEHERHGLLVPPGDPHRLAEAMRRLLDDPALALRLAQAARKRVEERYSRQAMVRRFEAFYHDLLWGTDFPCGAQRQPNHVAR
jgi:glycosyltransferase involved in cell wall biosynthesis